jgi:hypothetical protein
MANNVIRARGAPVQRSVQSPQGWPAPGTQDGNWVWDGSEWVCSPDCGYGGGVPAPCPPFGPPVFSGPVNQPPWYPGANGGVSFGAVAPPNPVRGHMWWDGTTFWLFDGAAWVAISAAGTAAGGTHSFVQPTAPTSATTGDIWWNGKEFYVWDGLAWNGVGPQSPMGVTDGSDASPGQVGQFVTFSNTVNFPTTAQVNQPVNLGTLQPGDWDCNMFAEASVFVTNLQLILSPVPPGFSGNMSAVLAMTVGTEAVITICPQARASLTAGTNITAAVTTNNVGAAPPTGGTATVSFNARRRR